MNNTFHNIAKLGPGKILLISLLVIFSLLTFLREIKNDRPMIDGVNSDLEDAVKIIRLLQSNFSSRYGLRYRALICTIVRNDRHLMEFIIRHLINGFSHIVIYDNNRIVSGHDTDISMSLHPFVVAGVVTHVRWGQNTTDLMTNPDKVISAMDCIHRYENQSDWIAYLDTDEYLYFEKNNKSVDTLNDLLMELEKDGTCAAKIPWKMMYGEAKLLKPNGSLLEAYPRVCKTNPLTKVLARPLQTIYHIPHDASCRAPTQGTKTLTSYANGTVALLHYYSKSMEEYLEKIDKSMPPYIRVPIASYDHGPKCHLSNFSFSDDYKNLFWKAYKLMSSSKYNIPKDLLATPTLNVKMMSDFGLYMLLKYRCGKSQEFDNEKYLATNSEAMKLVKQGEIVDGFYHFMLNFGHGAKGCWKSNNHSFCE